MTGRSIAHPGRRRTGGAMLWSSARRICRRTADWFTYVIEAHLSPSKVAGFAALKSILGRFALQAHGGSGDRRGFVSGRDRGPLEFARSRRCGSLPGCVRSPIKSGGSLILPEVPDRPGRPTSSSGASLEARLADLERTPEADPRPRPGLLNPGRFVGTDLNGSRPPVPLNLPCTTRFVPGRTRSVRPFDEDDALSCRSPQPLQDPRTLPSGQCLARSPGGSTSTGSQPTDRLSAVFQDCIHCGLCTASCPTYVETGDENDGPRGRIYSDAGRDRRPPRRLRRRPPHHLDLCLDCRACESRLPLRGEVRPVDRAVQGRPPEDRRKVRKKTSLLQRLILKHLFPVSRIGSGLALKPAKTPPTDSALLNFDGAASA